MGEEITTYSVPGDAEDRSIAVDIKGGSEFSLTKKDISDGSHTFGELYEHRTALFSVICNTYKDKAWWSLLHADGTMFDDDLFIAGIETPDGQYTHHCKLSYLHWFQDLPQLAFAPEHDGHKPKDYTRLFGLFRD